MGEWVYVCVSAWRSFYRRPGLLYLSSGCYSNNISSNGLQVLHMPPKPERTLPSLCSFASLLIPDAVAVSVVVVTIGIYSCNLPPITIHSVTLSWLVPRGEQQLFTIVSTLWRIAWHGLAFRFPTI